MGTVMYSHGHLPGHLTSDHSAGLDGVWTVDGQSEMVVVAKIKKKKNFLVLLIYYCNTCISTYAVRQYLLTGSPNVRPLRWFE